MRVGTPADVTLLQAQTAREVEVPAGPAGEDQSGLAEAARQFESIFLHQVFKSMRATIPEGGLLDAGFAGQVFNDMLDQEYAQSASRAGQLGLADLIVRDLGGGTARAASSAVSSGPTALRATATRAYRQQHEAANGWVMPVRGQLTSHFGPRRLPGEEARDHRGLDLAAPTGTPIRAARGGVVEVAGERGGYGNTVVIDHGGGLKTLYAHASELLVEAGQEVRAGAQIARVGSTGRSTGPHLHFEIRRDGAAIDPGPALGLDQD